MLDFLTNSLFFGVAVSLAAYEVGSLLKRKFKSPILNPLLISIILVIVVLVVCKVDYQSYNLSAKYLGNHCWYCFWYHFMCAVCLCLLLNIWSDT